MLDRGWVSGLLGFCSAKALINLKRRLHSKNTESLRAEKEGDPLCQLVLTGQVYTGQVYTGQTLALILQAGLWVQDVLVNWDTPPLPPESCLSFSLHTIYIVHVIIMLH